MDDFEKNLTKIIEEERKIIEKKKSEILANPGKTEDEKREYLKKVFRFALLPFFVKIINFYIEPLGGEAKIPLIQFDSKKRIAWAELTWDYRYETCFDESELKSLNSLKLTLDEDSIFTLFKAGEKKAFFIDTFADDCEGEWVGRLSAKILYIMENKLYIYKRYPKKRKVKVS